jgi:hypothetical protein
MVEAQTPWVGDGMYVRRPWERVASVILSLFDVPGGVTFSYLSHNKIHDTHNYVKSGKVDITYKKLVFIFFLSLYLLNLAGVLITSKVPECMWSWWVWVWGGCCVYVWVSSIWTGRVQTGESYLGCHIHVNALVSRRIQPESGGWDSDNQWTCVYVWASSVGTGKDQAGESYLFCQIHVNSLVSRRIQTEAGGCDCDNQWICVHVWASRIGTWKVQLNKKRKTEG